jgi:lantibiotic modifying enzyme
MIFLARERRDDSHGRRRRGRVSSCEEIVAPAVDFVVGLHRTALDTSRILQNSAWNDLRRYLSARLIFAVAPTLRVLQNATKAAGCRDEITLIEAITEFPDLLDTTARIISTWVDAQHELLVRIRRDEKVIRRIFKAAREPFSVRHIRPGLSDRHDGGRTATMLELGAGRRLIYKTRSANGEIIWFEALRWLNRNAFRVSFRIPTLLSRRDYFWMEFLRNKECATSDAVRRFYFRWGAQVAIAQLLGGIDLHRDNWLAIESQPVLLDAEFIGQPKPPFRRAGKILDRQLLPGLLETGLLPLTPRDRVGRYREIAALDATISKHGSPDCWPRYQRQLQPPSKYVNDLVRGFEEIAEVLSAPLLAKKFFRDVIVRSARESQTRVLHRATAQYSRVLRESLQAHNLISEGSRWRYLAPECCRTALNRKIGLAEARALLRCDIPKFATARCRTSVSWKGFTATLAELRNSSRLLRSRILLGAFVRRE